MGRTRSDEFRRDAVRIALTSGLTRKQVASDLGVGMSTLNKWITMHRDTDVVSKEDLSLAQPGVVVQDRHRYAAEEGKCRHMPLAEGLGCLGRVGFYKNGIAVR